MRVMAIAHSNTIEDALQGKYSITLIAADNSTKALRTKLSIQQGFVAYHGDAITGHRAASMYWYTEYDGALQQVVIAEQVVS